MRSLDQLWQLVARFWPGEKGRILREIGAQAQRLRADLVERGGEIVGADVTGYPGPNLNAVLESIAAGAPGGSPDALAGVVWTELLLPGTDNAFYLDSTGSGKLIYARAMNASWACIDWPEIISNGFGGATLWRCWLTNATENDIIVAPIKNGGGFAIPIISPQGRVESGAPPDVVDVGVRDILRVEPGETAMLAVVNGARLAPGGSPTASIVAQVYRVSEGGGGGPIASADITDSTAVGRSVLTAANAAAARTAIGTDASGTARPPTAHTHPLSDLTASGATTGQVPQWSGSEWVPTTPSGGSPGGSGTELQYRAGATAFGGMAGTAWDNTTRALTITGATVTTSNPILNLSQTWNAGGVRFTGWRLNVTNTASSANSRFLEFALNSTDVFAVFRNGRIFTELVGNDPNGGVPAGTAAIFFSASTGIAYANGGETFRWDGTSVRVAAGYSVGFDTDVRLWRDAAGRLAQRNGTNAQAFVVYNTESGSLANFERLNVEWSGNVAYIQPTAAGTGTLRPLVVRHPPITVASLPAAGTAGAGARCFVSDATATTFASVVAGGGGNNVPVYSDGTNWRIG